MNSRSGGNPPLRSMNMNTYASQQGSRQTPRLQNTQKPGLGGNNAGGWAFGPPSSGGFGGLGGAPGLGQARPGQLSGFAQVMGGGSGQGPIDMSDFPTLGGPQPRAPQSASGWNSSNIRQQQQAQAAPPQASAPQQQQPRAPSAAPLDQFDGQGAQQQPTERGGTGEEFPPLSGQQSGDLSRAANGFTDSPDQVSPQPSGPQAQLPIREPSSTMTSGQQAPIGSNQAAAAASPAPSMSQQSQQGQAAVSSYPRGLKLWSDLSEEEQWGMPGLQKTFETLEDHNSGRPIDPSLPPALQNVWLTLGHDLNSIGVELESTGPLFKTFHAFPDSSSMGASPFNSRARQVVPTFDLPQAYAVNNVPELRARIQAFSDETLFMIFYQLPRSLEQDLAAAELTHRDWRYHMVVRQWLRQDIRDISTPSNPPLVDFAKNIPAGSQPQQAPELRIERGVYIFLEPFQWQRERREFMLKYDELCDRHLYSGMSFVSPFPSSDQAPNSTAAGTGGMRMQSGQFGGIDRQNSVLSGA